MAVQIRKTELNFPSADGKSTISAAYYYDVDVVKIAILQIAHGMCEYKERYEPFIPVSYTHLICECA